MTNGRDELQSGLKETFAHFARGALAGSVITSFVLVMNRPQQILDVETGLFIAGGGIVAGVMNALTKSI